MRFFHRHGDEQGRQHGEPRHGRRFARFGHGHERGEHHFRRGARPGRLLEHGDLRLLILHLVAERPRHGYEIIKAIEDMAGGAYAPSPGVVYPTLTLLEELGQVAGTAEGSRKSYAITAAGGEALAAQREAVAAILARIAGAQPAEPALPVLRAMENLRTALRLKMGRTALAPEAARRIADALDAAARAVEEA